MAVTWQQLKRKRKKKKQMEVNFLPSKMSSIPAV